MEMMMLALAPVLSQLEADFDQSVDRLCTLMRIKSVSTDPAYKAETRRAGQWLVDELTALGFEASLRDTPGHPVLVAHHPGPGGDVPHILYYGHYDVQPPDPIDLWDTDPFEPTIVEASRGKRVVGRGAVDDKGQLMTFVEAFRAWIKVHGTLPVKVTVLFEGEEETGSPSLAAFLKANKEELKADVCVVSDTGSWDIDTPAITYMLRGMLYVNLTLYGPSRDLHSGMYGGAVVNPINALTRILGELHDGDGRVQIPGFYDDVQEVPEAERRQWAALDFDEKAFLGEIGLKTPAGGEKGRSPLERMWARPTCDINGIWGGYTGEGSKTVIAAHASAKVSCRLVAAQDPDKVLVGIRQFLDARTPPDFRWEIKVYGKSPAIRVPSESPYLQAAQGALYEVYQREPVLMGCGGSIPAVGMIQNILGQDSLLVGFGLEDDRVHSPNEKFELRCFRNGMLSHAAILARLAGVKQTNS
jgi:acetylornithine deacetylase/succinyl-diaminopimelate desuccinylase-like protein